MIIKAYAILDVKAGAYGTPFFSVNDQVALRSFGNLANDKGTSIGMNPEDFHLHQIGVFDDQTGEFAPGQVQSLAMAASLVRKEGGK